MKNEFSQFDLMASHSVFGRKSTDETLRDMFAGLFMARLATLSVSREYLCTIGVADAYDIAEAMMAERKRRYETTSKAG